ncbi:hypothetical protein QFZ37_000033 [Chryseobacterium ginsenosidimutans]|uniref:signal peptidase n=1 Tax=Chryseobacterium ginsenosidimutans TaxID=687846 RepID=UPI0027863EA0|nr:signal peptidase [Chryseobacterium ginsenosidimutans]MDQ0591664.1 hypothetical protein [Chryseobacterium ginsenosidimutans]
MKTINKLIYSFFLLAAFLVNAQPSNGGGGTGPGAPGSPPAAPIDMYVYALGIVAIMFIVFFTKKYTSKKA